MLYFFPQLQKLLVWCAMNQINNVIQTVSVALWWKKGQTIKTTLLQLLVLASYTLTSSVTPGAVTDPCYTKLKDDKFAAFALVLRGCTLTYQASGAISVGDLSTYAIYLRSSEMGSELKKCHSLKGNGWRLLFPVINWCHSLITLFLILYLTGLRFPVHLGNHKGEGPISF